MRIGFDVTPLSAPQSGVGTYTRNLLDHLSRQAGDEIVPLTHRRRSDGWTLNKTVWMQTVLPWQVTRLAVDICHFTNNVASLWAPCPVVVTVHDMTLWLTPEHHYGRRLLAMRPLIPLALQRAAAVIAVSQSTKRDVVRILGVPESKVHVIYEAAAVCFRPLPPGPDLEDVRRRFALPQPFILYVGTIEPRKNLVRLLEAFAHLRRLNACAHHLVFAGRRGWKDEPVFAAIERLGLQQSVHMLGYVPLADLVALYNLAEVMAFPSLYEGFGLPVVEAMACGTPVITSARGSLTEVAGDAAEYVKPEDALSIADGLERVLADPVRRAEMRERGLAQAAAFTWDSAAAQTRDLYARCLRGRAAGA